MNILGQNIVIEYSPSNIIPGTDRGAETPSTTIIPWIKYKLEWIPVYRDITTVIDKLHACKTVEELEDLMTWVSRYISMTYWLVMIDNDPVLLSSKTEPDPGEDLTYGVGNNKYMYIYGESSITSAIGDYLYSLLPSVKPGDKPKKVTITHNLVC